VEARDLKTVRSEWSRTLMICAKCSKKVGGGFGAKGKHSLAKVLGKELGIKTGRKAAMGIIEVKCLKVCPKGAVTVVDSRDSHQWKLVAAGAPIDAVIEALELKPSAPVQHEEAMVP
jgi:predicted metal-binding protein